MDIIHDIGEAAETLLAYVETKTTDQAPGSMEVPAASYLDPDRWALEMERIFKRLPLMLALSVELPEPGDYKAMDAMGLPVVMVRGKDGVVRSFLNVCAHRGAPVAAEGRGHCPGRLVCGYHGWTYSSDGRLLAVADREKFGDIDTSTRGLRPLPCEEQAGMIFVVLTPGAPIDVKGFLGGMLDELAAFRLDKWHFIGTEEIFGANWKIAYDGYLEGYHFATAHPKTIHPRTPSNVMKYDAYGPHMRTGYPQVGIGRLREVPREEWGRQENKGFDFVRTLFPNVSIFLAPEIAQIALLLPGPTPDRNRTVLFYISVDPPADEDSATTLQTMKTFLRNVTDQEDYQLGLQIQKGLESGALKSVIFGRNERGNQYFHKWVNYYIAGDMSAPEPVL